MRAFVAALLILATLSGCASEETKSTRLPAVSLQQFDGTATTDLSTLKGPLLVSLWASWCGPCRKEMPLLEEFSKAYEGRVDVLGIDFQDPQEAAARALVEQTGVTYPLLTDPGGEINAKGAFPAITKMPFLAFVDADGEVVHTEFVAVKSLSQLEDLAQEHLGVTR